MAGPEESSINNMADQKLIGRPRTGHDSEKGIRVAGLEVAPTNFMAGHKLVCMDIPWKEGISQHHPIGGGGDQPHDRGRYRAGSGGRPSQGLHRQQHHPP